MRFPLVDGDGRADAVVANYTHAEGPNLVPGRAWLVTRLAAGAEIDAGAGSATTITMPADASYRLGVGNSIAAAGDVDGDGYGDFLIGFDGGAVSKLTRGGLALVYGAAQLPQEGSLLAADGAPGTLRAGVVLGERVGDGFGYAADAAPAEGLRTRIAVGAPGADGGAGSVYHFDATALVPGVRGIGEIEGAVALLSAGAAARFGRSVAFVGRLLGTPTLAAGGDGVIHDGSGQEGFAHAAHVQVVAYEPVPMPTGPESAAPAPQPSSDDASAAPDPATPAPAADGAAPQAGRTAALGEAEGLARTGAPDWGPAVVFVSGGLALASAIAFRQRPRRA